MSNVCKLVHVLVVVTLSNLLMRRDALGLVWIRLIENLGQRLLDCSVWILRRSTTSWLLVLLKYLSVYHALNVLWKIF